jgi:transposase
MMVYAERRIHPGWTCKAERSGYKLKDIAQVYHVDHRRISVWIDRWHIGGFVGLYDQPRGGRPPMYNDQEQQQVEHYLQMYPQDVKRIIEEMAQETHKRVSPQTMKRYIKKSARLERV